MLALKKKGYASPTYYLEGIKECFFFLTYLPHILLIGEKYGSQILKKKSTNRGSNPKRIRGLWRLLIFSSHFH